MICLQRSLLAGLTDTTPTVQSVCASLQNAVELEHATIPPYLYALYSLAPDKNQEIAAIIGSVVVEEMLHMTLASNVLNALGGTPRIGQPGFIPTYPGPLPGGVEGDLTVNLAPFSMNSVGNFSEHRAARGSLGLSNRPGGDQHHHYRRILHRDLERDRHSR